MSLGIKKGDKVFVRCGKDKGKTGRVLKVLRTGERAIVEGVNIVKKHMRRRSEGDPTGVKEIPSSVNMSNLALFCSNCNKGVRFGTKALDSKSKMRVCKKCNQPIE
ncbi:MAG: 50S ribosomal protein L24 [Candidatus Omnitrophica bacterium]|nr:50S ribosomal protein L24 [Candidatus Omnitrophota bacterium]